MSPSQFLPSIGLISALIVAGCAGSPPATQVPAASPSAGAPSSEPTASQAPTAAPSVASSEAPNYKTAVMRGTVYDVAGKTVDGAAVRVRSLDPSRPFESSATTAAGKYAVTGVPVDTQLEITATRANWTTRTRIESLRTETVGVTNRNIINFGGPYDQVDPIGMSYFISDYPEIEQVEPRDESTANPNERMMFKMVMSESLDAINQRRLSSAFMIVPNDRKAIGEDARLPAETATDTDSPTEREMVGLNAGPDPVNTAAYRYRQNAGFMNGAVVSDFKWDADGRTATFTLEAPVKTDSSEEAEYAFLLVQQDKDPIVDGQNLPLGMNPDLKFGRTLRGEVIRNAVRENEVSLAVGQDDDAEERWAETHLSFTKFSVSPDRTAPSVVSVLARRGYADGSDVYDRVEVTFSEPMIAYPAIASNQLLSLNNYILSAASSEAEAESRKLGPNGNAININSGTGYQVARDAIAAERGAVIGSNGSVMNGGDGVFSITMSPTNPRVVVLRLPAGALPLDANVIKVYAGSDNGAPASAGRPITDPAGNSIQDNVKSGPIS